MWATSHHEPVLDLAVCILPTEAEQKSRVDSSLPSKQVLPVKNKYQRSLFRYATSSKDFAETDLVKILRFG